MSMKEQWVCRCGKDYGSEKEVLGCSCTMNGYTHQFICENCGKTSNQHQLCCDLFYAIDKHLSKMKVRHSILLGSPSLGKSVSMAFCDPKNKEN